MANKNKKKKKEKAYYEKEIRKKEIVQKSEKKMDLFSNTTFMICAGFLIIMYSRYVKLELSSQLITIFGLGVMGYGLLNSVKVHKGILENSKGVKEYSKTNLIIDYIMLTVIGIGILFNVFFLFKPYF